MDELLCVLICHFSFLYKRHSFRIVDSRHDSENFGNGLVQLANGIIEMQLTLDRGRFEIVLRPEDASTEWFSITAVADVLDDTLPSTAYCEYAATLSRVYPKLVRAPLALNGLS
jgi:hypothetical protein